MKNQRIPWTLSILAATIFWQACALSNDGLSQRPLRSDGIFALGDRTVSAPWRTDDLAIAFSYGPSSSPDRLHLQGAVTISNRIAYTFGKIRRLVLQVSFVDRDRKSVGTASIRPDYSAYTTIPDRMGFDATMALPQGAVAFCLGYSGEFVGDEVDMTTTIWHSPICR